MSKNITILDQMYDYLKKFPAARERKNRYKALIALIRRKYNISHSLISDSLLEAIISDGMTYNRYITRIQQTETSLRGNDYYNNKKILEQKEKIRLEYIPKHYQDIKKLKTLS